MIQALESRTPPATQRWMAPLHHNCTQSLGNGVVSLHSNPPSPTISGPKQPAAPRSSSRKTHLASWILAQSVSQRSQFSYSREALEGSLANCETFVRYRTGNCVWYSYLRWSPSAVTKGVFSLRGRGFGTFCFLIPPSRWPPLT